MSTGTSEGNLASLPYIRKNGEYFVVVWVFDLKENKVASRNMSQSSCLSLTSFLSALEEQFHTCSKNILQFVKVAYVLHFLWYVIAIRSCILIQAYRKMLQ